MTYTAWLGVGASAGAGLIGALTRPEPRQMTRLRIATATEVTRVALMGGAGAETQNVVWHLFDSLVTLDSKLDVAPRLATSWSRVSETEWRFKLRDGVRFSNGEPCDAFAVAHSIRHITSVNPPYLYRNQWGQTWPPVARVEDPLTVAVSTPIVQHALPRLMCRVAIVPPVASRQPGFDNMPIGSGPYRCTNWQRGRHLVLEANDGYFGGAPPIKQLVWTSIQNPASRLVALRSGDVDLIWDVPYERIQQVNQDRRFKVLEFASAGLAFLTFNFFDERSPVFDPRVRRAMTFAIDRKGIRDSLMSGRGELNTGPAPAQVIGSIDAGGYPQRDVARATTMLREAGYRNGLDLRLIIQPGTFQNDIDICGAIAAQLGEAGVRVEIEVLPPGAVTTRRRQKNWDIMTNSVPGSFTGEASYHYYQLKTQQGFTSPAVESLLDEAARHDGPVRIEWIRRAMRAFWDQTPYLWSVGMSRNFGTVSSFAGSTYVPVNWLLLDHATV